MDSVPVARIIAQAGGASKEFGVRIIGGDTNEANGLVIDCSMIGFASKMPTRKGANPGDVVVTSGTFGLPSAGLEILMRNAKGAGVFRKHAMESVLVPKPRQHFGIEELRNKVKRMRRIA